MQVECIPFAGHAQDPHITPVHKMQSIILIQLKPQESYERITLHFNSSAPEATIIGEFVVIVSLVFQH